MATITTAQAGNWSAGATWTGAAVPGDADTAEINHDVTFDASDQCTAVDIDGGKLTFSAGTTLTFTDSASCGITIRATTGTGLDSNATTASPCEIKSASASPTNKWGWTVYDYADSDARTINLDCIELTGLKSYLGNDDYYIEFNDGGATDPLLTHATPLTRRTIMNNHPIENRDYSRIYSKGMWAGTVNVSGRYHIDTWMNKTIDDIKKNEVRVAFFSHTVSLGKCRVESVRYQPTGSVWVNFNITLIEDM